MKFGFDILSPLLRILPPLVDFSRKKKQKKKETRRISPVSRRKRNFQRVITKYSLDSI